MRLPVLEKILAAKKVKAEPTDEAGSPHVDMKEAKKEFSEPTRPNLDEAKLSIQKAKGLGLEGCDVILNVPVAVDFLKGKKGGPDPYHELVGMIQAWLPKRVGVKLGQPSISTVDISRQRAKNGIKQVPVTFHIQDPLMCYALGANLSQFYFYNDVPSKKEIAARFEKAKKIIEEGKAINKSVRDGSAPQSAWADFTKQAQQEGFGHELIRMAKASLANTPALAKVLGEAEPEMIDPRYFDPRYDEGFASLPFKGPWLGYDQSAPIYPKAKRIQQVVDDLMKDALQIIQEEFRKDPEAFRNNLGYSYSIPPQRGPYDIGMPSERPEVNPKELEMIAPGYPDQYRTGKEPVDQQYGWGLGKSPNEIRVVRSAQKTLRVYRGFKDILPSKIDPFYARPGARDNHNYGPGAYFALDRQTAEYYAFKHANDFGIVVEYDMTADLPELIQNRDFIAKGDTFYANDPLQLTPEGQKKLRTKKKNIKGKDLSLLALAAGLDGFTISEDQKNTMWEPMAVLTRPVPLKPISYTYGDHGGRLADHPEMARLGKYDDYNSTLKVSGKNLKKLEELIQKIPNSYLSED